VFRDPFGNTLELIQMPPGGSSGSWPARSDVFDAHAGDADCFLRGCVPAVDLHVALSDAQLERQKGADGFVRLAPLGRGADADLEALSQSAGDGVAPGSGDSLEIN
jgi:hypothetical protein